MNINLLFQMIFAKKLIDIQCVVYSLLLSDIYMVKLESDIVVPSKK